MKLFVGAFIAGVLCSPPVRADVIAYAAAGAGINGSPNGWGDNATGSGAQGAYAVAFANSDHTSGAASGPLVQNLSTIVCDPGACATDARAIGNGATGAVSVFGGSGLYPTLGGGSISQVEMFDTVTFNSPTATFNLDLFYSEFYATHPSSPAPFWEAASYLQAYLFLTATAEDSDFVYVGSIDIHDTYTSGFGLRNYSICDGLQIPCVEGTNFPVTNGHLGYSATVDVAQFVGTPVSLYYRVLDTSSCGYGVASGDCTAISDSSHTSYLGIQGDFTSANGYQYLGATPVSSVPEPGTHVLIGLTCAVGAVWRKRRSILAMLHAGPLRVER